MNDEQRPPESEANPFRRVLDDAEIIPRAIEPGLVFRPDVKVHQAHKNEAGEVIITEASIDSYSITTGPDVYGARLTPEALRNLAEQLKESPHAQIRDVHLPADAFISRHRSEPVFTEPEGYGEAGSATRQAERRITEDRRERIERFLAYAITAIIIFAVAFAVWLWIR